MSVLIVMCFTNSHRSVSNSHSSYSPSAAEVRDFRRVLRLWTDEFYQAFISQQQPRGKAEKDGDLGNYDQVKSCTAAVLLNEMNIKRVLLSVCL